jgi:hypothetical protein
LYATVRTAGILVGSVMTAAAVLLAPGSLAAQVGLPSGVAQVTLVARAAPQGSIQAVRASGINRAGGTRESSVDLRLLANATSKVVARSTGASAARVWVRAATGTFEELKAGIPVIVAQGSHFDGDQQVQYRIETPEDGQSSELPSIVYDLVIAPTI